MSKTVFASKDDASEAAAERRKHILCADYHDSTRAMIAYWLDLCGYEVTAAGSLAETLPLTERGGFNLLILGGWYPDSLGINLCKRIRAFDARTPIVFLSAYAFTSDIKEGLESGAQDYITKPFDFDVLKQTIEKLIL